MQEAITLITCNILSMTAQEASQHFQIGTTTTPPPPLKKKKKTIQSLRSTQCSKYKLQQLLSKAENYNVIKFVYWKENIYLVSFS